MKANGWMVSRRCFHVIYSTVAVGNIAIITLWESDRG